jgi:membrane-bound lytic murein transglycosylase A
MRRFNSIKLIVLTVGILAGCAAVAPPPDEKTPAQLTPVGFDSIPGWRDDDLTLALPALQRSCGRILQRPSSAAFGPLPEAGTYARWQPMCRDFLNLSNPSRVSLRVFFETRFQPYEISAGSNANGLFTGYYEASLRGSLKKHGQYRYPLHLRPADLVMVNLGEFREELKGQRIAGRVVDGNLKPYEDRAAIVSGQWPHNDAALVWVDDPADAFFVQVQGSGVVALDDGSVMRIGYAGQNGHPYYAIGRELIKRGHLQPSNVSMQSIAAWLRAHPSEADEIMNTNKSYVFFKPMTEHGAKGAEGVVLTPGRSIAVDSSKLPFGAPMFVNIAPPAPGKPPIHGLMIAQDTGGAIRGAVRGDVFWGFGPQAEALAGPMKSQGKYWILLPKDKIH